MSLITVRNLVKIYQRRARQTGTMGALKGLFSRETVETRALDGVSFSIDQGELVGYIGPNGAGKSTTIKLLSGILVPDGGECVVDGLVPWQNRTEHVAKIGVVFGQRPQLWWDLPVIESFELLRDVYRLEHSAYRQTLDELVDRLQLHSFLDQPVRLLSLGQRMRADLAASLLHRPKILFLDEPTIGLDAPGKLAVREFVRRLNKEDGVTVVLTTHDMDDIETLSTRLLVIGGGRIIADGTTEIIHAQLRLERRIVVDTDPRGTVSTEGASTEADARLGRLVAAGGGTFERSGGQLSVTIDPHKVPVSDVLSLITSEYTVRDVFIEAPPIEEIVARLYAAAEAPK